MIKRHVHKDPNTKTERQWQKEGRLLKENAKGEDLWTNGFCQVLATYYSIEETMEATKEEIRIAREPELARRREQARKRYAEKKEQEKQQREKEKALEYRNTELQKAHDNPVIPCENPSKIVCFDVETTGLDWYWEDDEILQFSAIDGDGNVLLNTYIKPYFKKSWDKAQAINGISPQMVENAPYIHELVPIIKGIFDSADVLIAYNGEFDIAFLNIYDIKVDYKTKKYYDVMLWFAEIYGEWSEYYENFKWQKLTTCASYYGYDFKAHDSLEDTKATLYCWKCIMKNENK